MYRTLGWINVGLYALLILPFLLGRLNRHVFKIKDKRFTRFLKFLRTLHKPAGILLLLTSAVHGWLALGSIRLHTGTVLFLSVAAAVTLGGSLWRIKNKKVFTWHRLAAGLALILLLLHILAPRAFS